MREKIICHFVYGQSAKQPISIVMFHNFCSFLIFAKIIKPTFPLKIYTEDSADRE